MPPPPPPPPAAVYPIEGSVGVPSVTCSLLLLTEAAPSPWLAVKLEESVAEEGGREGVVLLPQRL